MYDTDKIANIPIKEVAERLGLKLKKRGKDFVINCLWHEDKHPSMVVGGKYNRVHCFSCDKDYGVLDLVMRAYDMDFKGACEWLVNEAFLPAPSAPACWLRSKGRRKGRASFGENRLSYLKRLEHLQARNSPPTPKGGEDQYSYFKDEYLNEKITMQDSFSRSMIELFGREKTSEIVRMYRLGAYELYYGYPAVMFPNININGDILDIKIQSYDCNPYSSLFFHKIDNICFWLKSYLLNKDDIDKDKIFKSSKAGSSPRGSGERGYCLFGEHPIKAFPSKTVLLTESAKNACVCAAAYPRYLCIATGNKNMLKREVLEVLRGRNVLVFPDNDAFDEWNEKLKYMQDIALFHCIPVPGNFGPKADIADWIIKRKEYNI